MTTATENDMTATTTATEFKWLRAATGLLLVGGVAWLLKFATIAMSKDDEGILVGPLFFIGFFGMLLGAAGIFVWLTWRFHVVVRIVAGLVGALVFFESMEIVDSLAKSVAGDTGPAYLLDEWGILFTAILWLGVGLGAGARYRSMVARRTV